MKSASQHIEATIKNHGERAYRVAYGMLGDAGLAYDALQNASIVVAKKYASIPTDNAWPWFQRIVVLEAHAIRRKRARRAAHETNASPELWKSVMNNEEENGPDELLDREFVQKQLWEALDALSEAERDAVVLTQMNGMTHKEAAAALGIPEGTLSSNVSRGLTKLRQSSKLSTSALGVSLAALPILQPPSGMAAALSSWTSAGLSALGSSAATFAAVSTGAAIMVKKSVVIASVAVALVAGGGIGFLSNDVLSDAQPAPQPETRVVEDTSKLDEAQRELKKLKSDYESLQRKKQEVKVVEKPVSNDSAIEKLTAQISELERKHEEALSAKDSELTALKAALSEIHNADDHSKVDVDSYESISAALAKLDVNWQDVAKNAIKMREMAAQLLIHFQEGTQQSAEFQELVQEIQATNAPLASFAIDSARVIPSQSESVNAAFTHPVVMINMAREALVQAGKPLSDAQIKQVEASGAAYLNQLAKVKETYNEMTPRLVREGDEFKLRLAFVREFRSSILTANQRSVLWDPTTQGRQQLDIYSPVISYMMGTQNVNISDPEKASSILKSAIK
ncbi:MAG: sigma-70 family RNA polymerase sigma factor, partial [Planctomycetes bacterium]|nr:sigma-70 family RNA polymerase sigma factor [Planctomycetota bacterium]